MWVRLNDRELVNVDAKVVMIRKTDTMIQGNPLYYISFFESYSPAAINSAKDLKFSTMQERDTAFETINNALEVVSIERES